jgi:hypothetical protein
MKLEEKDLQGNSVIHRASLLLITTETWKISKFCSHWNLYVWKYYNTFIQHLAVLWDSIYVISWECGQEEESSYHIVLCQCQTGAGQKGKIIPVTGREDPYSCETSRLPHLLDNRLTDGGEVIRLTCRPPFTSQEDSWYSFMLEAESTPGP